MRPVQLELTNFGPYRKEVINFTTFNSNCWDGVCWVKKRRQTNIR